MQRGKWFMKIVSGLMVRPVVPLDCTHYFFSSISSSPKLSQACLSFCLDGCKQCWCLLYVNGHKNREEMAPNPEQIIIKDKRDRTWVSSVICDYDTSSVIVWGFWSIPLVGKVPIGVPCPVGSSAGRQPWDFKVQKMTFHMFNYFVLSVNVLLMQKEVFARKRLSHSHVILIKV